MARDGTTTPTRSCSITPTDRGARDPWLIAPNVDHVESVVDEADEDADPSDGDLPLDCGAGGRFAWEIEPQSPFGGERADGKVRVTERTPEAARGAANRAKDHVLAAFDDHLLERFLDLSGTHGEVIVFVGEGATAPIMSASTGGDESRRGTSTGTNGRGLGVEADRLRATVEMACDRARRRGTLAPGVSASVHLVNDGEIGADPASA